MSIASYILGIVVALLVLVLVIEMLRRRRLRERHAVWWLLAGILALTVGAFPSVLDWLALLVGVQTPTNLVFFVAIAILFLVCLQYGAELTKVESQTRVLAERVALLEQRLGPVPPAGTLAAAQTADDLARNNAGARGAQVAHDERDVVTEPATYDAPTRARGSRNSAIPRGDG